MGDFAQLLPVSASSLLGSTPLMESTRSGRRFLAPDGRRAFGKSGVGHRLSQRARQAPAERGPRALRPSIRNEEPAAGATSGPPAPGPAGAPAGPRSRPPASPSPASATALESDLFYVKDEAGEEPYWWDPVTGAKAATRRELEEELPRRYIIGLQVADAEEERQER